MSEFITFFQNVGKSHISHFKKNKKNKNKKVLPLFPHSEFCECRNECFVPSVLQNLLEILYILFAASLIQEHKMASEKLSNPTHKVTEFFMVCLFTVGIRWFCEQRLWIWLERTWIKHRCLLKDKCMKQHSV